MWIVDNMSLYTAGSDSVRQAEAFFQSQQIQFCSNLHVSPAGKVSRAGQWAVSGQGLLAAPWLVALARLGINAAVGLPAGKLAVCCALLLVVGVCARESRVTGSLRRFH